MGFWMYILLFFYAISCFILIMVILLQSGKGGGLSSLGSANQGIAEAFGSTGAERTLTRWTTYAAVGFIVFALAISLLSSRAVRRSGSIINKPAPTTPPLTSTGLPPTAKPQPAQSGAVGIPNATEPTLPNAPVPNAPAGANKAPLISPPAAPAAAPPVAPPAK